MGKHRIYEIAKELGKTNQEVIDVLAKNDIHVKGQKRHPCKEFEYG